MALGEWAAEQGFHSRCDDAEVPDLALAGWDLLLRHPPRGMGFLYNLNRLNVATSRARCCCVMVASPALFEPMCGTVGEMRLANGMCEYRTGGYWTQGMRPPISISRGSSVAHIGKTS